MVLDSELLLLFVVGTTGRGYVSKHRRLRAYSEKDFELLLKVISNATEVLVTPNTLSETSNLLAYAAEPMRSELFQAFALIITDSSERYVPSSDASTRSEFVRLGLTDSALLAVSSTGNTLLTADLDLYLAASSQGLEPINFNHLREAAGTV